MTPKACKMSLQPTHFAKLTDSPRKRLGERGPPGKPWCERLAASTMRSPQLHPRPLTMANDAAKQRHDCRLLLQQLFGKSAIQSTVRLPRTKLAQSQAPCCSPQTHIARVSENEPSKHAESARGEAARTRRRRRLKTRCFRASSGANGVW